MRQIPVDRETIKASVEGDVDAVDRVLRITRIRVRHTLKIPSVMRAAAERAVATHEQKCPAATSVRGCIPIEIAAEITEI